LAGGQIKCKCSQTLTLKLLSTGQFHGQRRPFSCEYAENWLSPDEIVAIDQQVELAIPKADFGIYPRNIAIVHLLMAYEDHARLYLPQLLAKNRSDYQIGLKLAQDSMHFAMDWIFQFAKENANRPNFAPNSDLYFKMSSLRREAESYSRVFDYLSHLRRGWSSARRDENGIIRIKALDPSIDRAEVFDIVSQLEHHSEAIREPGRSTVLTTMEPRQLLQLVNARKTAEGKVAYDAPKQLIEQIKIDLNTLTNPLWEMESSWDLGGYCIQEFRQFWISLLAIVLLHDYICMISGLINVTGGALDSLVLIANRDRWTRRLASVADLDGGTVAKIVQDLVYKPELYTPGKKRPDITFQPFFDLGNNILAVSNTLITQSNAERNIWDLVSIIRPKLHSDLRNEKEGLWLQQLEPICKGYGLTFKSRIPYIDPKGKKRDIDVLLIDEENRFGLALQLKWLTAPDRLNQIASTNSELQYGIEQAENALNWCNTNREALATKIGFAKDALSDYQIEAAVLTRNTTGGGRVFHPDFPILHERLLHWTLGEPHKRSLRTLYRIGSERTYLPNLNEVYIEDDTHGEFGGLHFIGENSGMLPIRVYDPLLDIKFPLE
jgi:hypothetical protein